MPIHVSSYSWSSLARAESTVEQFVLIHLKCRTWEQSSPCVLWGVFLLNLLKQNNSFSRSFCSNWTCLLYSIFSTSLRTPAYIYDSWAGGRKLLLLVTKGRNRSFQIKIADKWPYKAKEIKEVWEWGKLDSLASNSIWLKPTGDSLHSGGSVSFLRQRSHLGPPDDPWGVRKKPWSYSTH